MFPRFAEFRNLLRRRGGMAPFRRLRSLSIRRFFCARNGTSSRGKPSSMSSIEAVMGSGYLIRPKPRHVSGDLLAGTVHPASIFEA